MIFWTKALIGRKVRTQLSRLIQQALMNSLLAVIDFNTVAVGAVIGAIIGYLGGGASRRSDPDLRFHERQLKAVQDKLDALLKHQGIALPPQPSELEFLASSPDTKIAAIRLYREQNPGVSLAEAKAKVEALAAKL